MAVRRDKVQLDIEFITDESRALAKANTDTKALTRELRKTVKEGGDVADVMRRIEQAGAKVEDIDLSQVAPAQLVTRARQLKQVLDQLPSSSPRAKKLADEYKRINDRLAEIRRNTRGVAGGRGGLFASLTARATGLLAAVTAALAAVRGLFNFVAGGVSRAAAFEQLNVSLEVFLGSAEKAQKAIKDLNEFSIRTPFEPEQVNQAGRALLAFGVSQDIVIDKLGRIGNIAAGTGKDFNELTLIYGKARAAGRIQGEELNQLAEAGIPIYEELAKVVGVNATEIRKLGEEGRLSFNDLDAVFQNLTNEGGRFNGLLEKQSTTLTGLASTAKGAFGALPRNIGEAFTPLLKTILPPVINLINRAVEVVAPLAQAFGQKLVQAFQFVRRAVRPLIDAFGVLLDGLRSVSSGSSQIGQTFQLLGATFTLISNIVAVVIRRFGQLLSVFGNFGVGEGGIINKVLTAPFKFLLTVIIQVIAVLNGLVSVSGVITDELKNVFGIFTDSIGLAIDKVKGFFTDNERAIFEGEQRLAARYRAAGRKIGDAFTKGYNDAIGDINVETAAPEADRDPLRTGGTITNPLAPKPPTEAQLRKAAEERARIEAEIARRAKNVPVEGIESTAEPVTVVDASLAEIEAEEARVAKLTALQEQLAAQRLAVLQREMEARKQLENLKVQAAQESLTAIIGILSRDEEARKKNSGAIKAFQKAQTILGGILEVQQIRTATATQAATAGPLAPVVLALGAVRTVAAIARTALAVSKIDATKFARGGTPKIGQFGGRSHAAGGTRGVFEDGTQIEVEAGETFAVVNKNARGLLGFLSDANVATGGVPFFQRGGIVANAPSTTPVIGPETAATRADGGGQELAAGLGELRATVEAMRNIRATLVYTEFEDVGADLNTARAAAEV